MGEDLNRTEAIQKIAGMMKDIKIAMLSTITPEGSIHSRPMATQETEFAGEVWFLSRQDSGKTDEIQHNSRVTLNYVDSKSYCFVSLAGRAEISKDRSKIHELWNPLYKAWFPQGEEDPQITIIRVDVDQAEYWDSPGNGLIRGIQILKAAVTHGAAPVGEHQKIAV